MSGAGEAALAEAADTISDAPSPAELARARARWGERTAAIVEATRLRRRARVKLPEPLARRWLTDADGLEQATPWAVARHRARRLDALAPDRPVHDLTCAAGTELAALAAGVLAGSTPAGDGDGTRRTLLGSDLDPMRLALAVHNVQAASFVRADALAPVSRDTRGGGAVLVADPARRVGGRRTARPADLLPPLPELLDACAGRDLAVKCAPGLDVDALEAGTGWAGEAEVVSVAGAVKELCLYTRGLAGSGIRRRATLLRGPGGEVVETISDAEPDDVPVAAVGEWIVEPDGAIVRAGLVRHWAARHGLWQLDERIAHLTGDRLPAGIAGFRVLERRPLTEKVLRAALRARDCGALEILVRGVGVDPDVLRRRLRPTGTVPHTLVLTRIGRSGVAFVCARREVGPAGAEASATVTP